MKATLSRLLFFGLCISTISGCLPATLVFGRHDKVAISTEPAGVAIYDREGFNIGITPAKLPLKRFPNQSLTFRLDGYEDTTVVMSRRINEWAAPMCLFQLIEFGVPGLLFIYADGRLGGLFKKSPNSLLLKMRESQIDTASVHPMQGDYTDQ